MWHFQGRVSELLISIYFCHGALRDAGNFWTDSCCRVVADVCFPWDRFDVGLGRLGRGW